MADTTNIIYLEDGWNNEIKIKALDPLERMLDEGFNDKQKTKLFNNQLYVSIYTICYNMCTQRSPYNWSEQLYQRHSETIKNYLQTGVLPALRHRHDEFLLHELVRRGTNHKIMNKWLKNFFQYLDRYYVRYHSLPTLEDAGMKHFKLLVFDEVKRDICNAILKLVDRERDGDVVDRNLIRECITLFESMGMGSLDIYTEDFEKPLLISTQEFYARKSEAWLQNDSTPTYLIKTERAIEEESIRVQNYLNPETLPKLLRVIEEVVLEKRSTELLEKDGSGCRVLLINDMSEDLSRMFRLFSRVPNGLEPMATIVKQHIADLGNDKIDQRLLRLESGNDKESNEDPQFVKDLLSIHDRFKFVIDNHFESNSLFQKALKDAFVEVVNRDLGKFKTADLMSSFCDRILKTGSIEKLNDSEIEDYLEKTVQLFSYLTDKDLFAEIYRNQLAKRLLSQRSASNDMERLMIGKLKIRCGAQFTSKMEGMLNDLSIGEDHAQQFKDYCIEKRSEVFGPSKMDFSVQVLTSGHWPTYKSYEMNLPPVMQTCTNIFKEYYDINTSKRRLQWTHTLGNAVVKGMFGKKSYQLQITTLQAVVLLSFNFDIMKDRTQWSFTDLLETIDMPEEILKRVLHSLSCGKFKVLRKINSSNDASDKKDEKTIRNTDEFVFNDTFTCQLNKIRIPMASLEEMTNVKRVEEDRSIAIEASVVRIMKARKTFSHQQLVAEVLSQLAFFRPDPKLIKRRIEALIDREYLERDSENNNTYKYLA